MPEVASLPCAIQLLQPGGRASARGTRTRGTSGTVGRATKARGQTMPNTCTKAVESKALHVTPGLGNVWDLGTLDLRNGISWHL